MAGLSVNIDERDAKRGMQAAGGVQLGLLAISLIVNGLPQKPIFLLLVWASHTAVLILFVYLDVTSVTEEK